jgi:uncharacterized protein (DUF885 family)
MVRRRLLAASLFVLASACACGRPMPSPAPAATRAGASNFPAFVDRYVEAYLAMHPNFAVSQGRHEFDGQLSDWSPASLQREVAWLEHQREEALAFSERALSPLQRFQRDYVLSRIEEGLFWLREVRTPFTNPAFYVGALEPHTYVSVPYAPIEQRLAAFIKYAAQIPSQLAQARANIETPLPKTFIDYAVAGFNGYAAFYRNDVPRAFAAAKDPQLQQQLQAVLEPAARAMSETAEWVAAAKVATSDSYALGTDRFTAMLRTAEGVTTPLTELEQIGRADLARNLAALEAACKAYLPGGTVTECVERQAADKPTEGDVECARNQLAELRRYIVDHQIVSIPGNEAIGVAEAPPYMRQNFAYIDIPGPYEKNLPSVYYIAPPDPAWTAAEQAAYVPGKGDLLFTSAHEVWPGHFLQFLHSNRLAWRFGQLFVGYAFAEGWAHYAEELMVEEGLAKDAPELQVGQLLNALLRNVRFVCAIGLHTQGMSVAQCEQLFKDKAYQDPGNARQQAARGTYDPGYLNYTMGKLMIRKLRERWMAENPGHTRREFHDRFLSFGGPPIPLLRTQLLKDSSGSLF